MDNVLPSHAFPNTCAIKLDQNQYTFYKKSRIEIHAPNGKILTVLREPIPNTTDEDAIFELWVHTCRLEVLFDEIQEKVKIPQRAIIGITQITDRIDMHLRRQAGL